MDREAPRKAFYDAINGQTPFHQNVMMYYGIGGIGKSSLIKKLKEDGMTYREVSESIGTSVSNVKNIVLGRTWKWLFNKEADQR